MNAFRKGQAVENKEAWKVGQVGVNTLSSAIMLAGVVANALGIPVPVDVATANMIASGIVGVVNVGLTIATSETIGV